MGLQIELKPFSIPEHELEEIRIIDIKGESKRIGFCPTFNGATCRFVRILTDEQRKEVVAEVTRLRKERGQETDARSSQPPDPEEIRRAMRKDKAKA